MCVQQGWKGTGAKPKVLKRLVKKMKCLLDGKAGMDLLIESKIGQPTKVPGPSAQLRRFYTDNYGALDRFDRLWYEIKFFGHPRDWESHFCWSLLHSAIVNARALYCVARNERVAMRPFLEGLLVAYEETLAQ
jgi:hypothetical protein